VPLLGPQELDAEIAKAQEQVATLEGEVQQFRATALKVRAGRARVWHWAGDGGERGPCTAHAVMACAACSAERWRVCQHARTHTCAYVAAVDCCARAGVR
jgi:hypothetical protein